MSNSQFDKIAKLRKLRTKIESELGEGNSWFHKDEERIIKGFLGASDLIIIGDRPATRKKRDKFIDLLYETLVENRLEDAHLTDFIKRRGKAGKWSIEDMKESLQFLNKELEIVFSKGEPWRIICLGDRVYNWVCPFIASLNVEANIQKSRHYACRFGKKQEREKKFKDSFNKAFKEVMKSELH